MRSIDWSKTAVGPVDGLAAEPAHRAQHPARDGLPHVHRLGTPSTRSSTTTATVRSSARPSTRRRWAISTRETFAEIWDIIGPMFQGVMEGRPTTFVDFMLPLDRHGFTEECYFIFSYSPIREESGRVGGVLVTVTETTQRVLGERRLKTTQALAAETREAKTVREACEIAGHVLASNTADLPFALHLSDQPTTRQRGSLPRHVRHRRRSRPDLAGDDPLDAAARRPWSTVGPCLDVWPSSWRRAHRRRRDRARCQAALLALADRAAGRRASHRRPGRRHQPAPHAGRCLSRLSRPGRVADRHRRSPAPRRSRRRRRAPRRSRSSIAPRPRSSAMSATSSARRSR